MITDNILVQFVVCVVGCVSIGRVWFGGIGTIAGLFLGLFLFYKLRKRKKFDYDRIEQMFDDRLGPRRKN